MTVLRRSLALAATAALAVTLAPIAAQAADGDNAAAKPTAGASLAAGNVAGSDARVQAKSPFFAGHEWAGDDADLLSEATFRIHSWTCDADDEGVLSSILTYDTGGFFNGGPGVFMYCSGGVQSYAPVFLDFALGQTPVAGEVAGGDLVRMTVSREGGMATYGMENITQGWSETSTGTGDYANGFVQTGDASISLGGVDVPAMEFGRDPVRAVSFDGALLGESTAVRVQRTNDDGTEIVERATTLRGTKRFILINKIDAQG